MAAWSASGVPPQAYCAPALSNGNQAGCVHLSKERNDSGATPPLPRQATERRPIVFTQAKRGTAVAARHQRRHSALAECARSLGAPAPPGSTRVPSDQSKRKSSPFWESFFSSKQIRLPGAEAAQCLGSRSFLCPGQHNEPMQRKYGRGGSPPASRCLDQQEDEAAWDTGSCFFGG